MTLTAAFRDARDRVASLGMGVGYFDRVAQHEPKNAPGKGLSLFVFLDQFQPVQTSGLRSTSVRLVLNAQLRCSMTREPQDDIDVDLIEAADALCAAISADFRLGDTVRAVDLLGQHGPAMGALGGYIDQDGHKFRVIDLTIPCLVNDVWMQG